MIRPIHRWIGLALALLVSLTALSGSVLAIFPVADTLGTSVAPDVDVGSFAARLQETIPGLEQIRRAVSGRITVYAYADGFASQWVVDPASGAVLEPLVSSPSKLWFTNLHRAYLGGDAGRIAAGGASLAILFLCLTGFLLAKRRVGGWKRLFGRLRGPWSQRLHLEVARLAGLGLLLSSVTGLWLFALTFGFAPEGSPLPPFPEVSGAGGLAPSELSALTEIPLAALRELTFPRDGNLTDVFTIKTDAGFGYIDQGSGEVLAWTNRTALDKASGIIHMLHTGDGAAVLGMLLGLAALSVPVLSVTGYVQQSGRVLLPWVRKATTAAGNADTIILVGTEGGATWTFAERLRTSLNCAGLSAHVAPMSNFSPEIYTSAQRVLILAATSGDGDAPGSAAGFLDRVASMRCPPSARVAVLGFGDRSFPRFCTYAEQVCRAVRQAGWQEFLPLTRIDRQSQIEIADWIDALSKAVGARLALADAKDPILVNLKLVSRRDYGVEDQAPTSILRFEIPRLSLWQRLTGRGFARFQAGDLIGVIPVGDATPRYYSLASGSRDGFVEICVRKHPGGLCSGQLAALRPGEVIPAFVRPNPTFHPSEGTAPLILIGAGAGIGPLAGFARANDTLRPMHMYFGTRSSTSSLFYGEEFVRWRQEGKLSSIATAYSRSPERAYVQDALRRDAEAVRHLIAQGAQIMVCGGREMAAEVFDALETILAPATLSPITLKKEGRYVEDVF